MAKKKNMQTPEDMQKYEASIKAYADQIEQLTFVEAVRKLPGMYIGSIGNLGWKSCIREIAQNAFDEAARDDSPCDLVMVTFDERNQSAMIEDNGRGVPHSKMRVIYSEAHSGSHYENVKGSQYSSGVHGVGAGVAMSLSDVFKATSYVLGTAHQIEFSQGQCIHDEHEVAGVNGRQGTSVFMSPDFGIMGQLNISWQEIFEMLANIIPLLPINTELQFTGIDMKGNVHQERVINTDGYFSFLNKRVNNAIINPITFACDTGVMKAEAAFVYDSSDLTADADIISFANFTNTTGGGTHVQGFLDGLVQYLRTYMNKIYLGEKSKLNVTANDIKTGLVGVINVAHINPIFMGQFKGILSNEDMQDFVKKLTIDTMEKWSKTNPTELAKLAKFLKDVCELRMKSEGEKIKLSDKYTQSKLTGKPKNYVQPSGTKDLELFIVEGRSAKGSAMMGRDYTKQGIFPIRGKMPNAMKEGRAKFLSNPEVAAIISLIGGGYGRDFDISKVKWDKVCLFADADADGGHIRCLVLLFFLLYMPGLIEAGKVYAVIPPLYGIPIGRKGQMKYFVSTLELTKYLQTLFLNKHEFCSSNKTKFTASQATSIFYRNRNYLDQIKFVCDTFAIDRELLEAVLYEIAPYVELGSGELVANMAVKKPAAKKAAAKKTTKKTTKKNTAKSDKVAEEESSEEDDVLLPVLDHSVAEGYQFFIRPEFDPKVMMKNLKKQFRFMNYENKNGTILINGLVNSRSQYVFIDRRFINCCMDLIQTIKGNDKFYRIDGELVSIYGLMKLFDDVKPSNITRYKGLGEQSPNELSDVMRPDGHRTLVQYTLESAKAEIEGIRHTQSNMYALLRDMKVEKDEVE